MSVYQCCEQHCSTVVAYMMCVYPGFCLFLEGSEKILADVTWAVLIMCACVSDPREAKGIRSGDLLLCSGSGVVGKQCSASRCGGAAKGTSPLAIVCLFVQGQPGISVWDLKDMNERERLGWAYGYRKSCRMWKAVVLISNPAVCSASVWEVLRSRLKRSADGLPPDLCSHCAGRKSTRDDNIRQTS